MIYPSFDKFIELTKQGNIIPIYKAVSADLLTPVSAFLRIEPNMPNAFLLEASGGLQPSLEKFIITEDVTIEDVSSLLRCYLIIRWEGHAPSWPKTAGEADAMLRGSVQAPRVPPELDLPADAVTFAHPLGTGVISPVPLPVTLDAPTLGALRIEAGIPQWGVDMDENTIPVEAGLAGRAISYDKGCYIGQETIARIKTYGHVNRQLVQLAVNSKKLPAKGEQLMAGDKSVGHVTSAAYSNRLGKTLALGYVRREFAMAGEKLTVGEQSAEVLKICGQ